MVGVVDGTTSDLAAYFGQSPVADGQNQPALLGERNKVHGRDKPALGMSPANQRLKTDNLARRETRPPADSRARTRAGRGRGEDPLAWPFPGVSLSARVCRSPVLGNSCADGAVPTGWPPYRPGSRASAVRPAPWCAAAGNRKSSIRPESCRQEERTGALAKETTSKRRRVIRPPSKSGCFEMSGTTTGPSSASTISKIDRLRGSSRTASPQ